MNIDGRVAARDNPLMTRFLVTYHGGGMPEGDAAAEQAMAAFAQWAA